VVVCDKLPLVPVMVMVLVPRVARLLSVMVMVDVPDPVTLLGLKTMVVPLASPDAVRLTAELNPPTAPIVTVTEPELLLATEMEPGLALMVKLGAVPLTVRVTVVVSTRLPEVPVTVMG
jgi:hypothetical protein